MAHDDWYKPDGKRWASPLQIRVARRFRRHVRCKSNPHGRIRRERCGFCLREGHPTTQREAEAHHLDYDRPFVVVWVCHRHHRQVDHGGVEIPTKLIWDYSSLIRMKPTRWINTPF